MRGTRQICERTPSCFTASGTSKCGGGVRRTSEVVKLDEFEALCERGAVSGRRLLRFTWSLRRLPRHRSANRGAKRRPKGIVADFANLGQVRSRSSRRYFLGQSIEADQRQGHDQLKTLGVGKDRLGRRRHPLKCAPPGTRTCGAERSGRRTDHGAGGLTRCERGGAEATGLRRFSDPTLVELANERPRALNAMADSRGVGIAKMPPDA